jgi:hypothetical protein
MQRPDDPQAYSLQEGEDKLSNSGFPMTGHIPIVDVTRLSSKDQRDRGQVAAEIGTACRGIGFFYIINVFIVRPGA